MINSVLFFVMMRALTDGTRVLTFLYESGICWLVTIEIILKENLILFFSTFFSIYLARENNDDLV